MYTATQNDLSALPDMITFDSSTYTFTVDETLITGAIVYTLMVTGQLSTPGTVSSTISFTVTLTGCVGTTITTVSESDQAFSYSDVVNTVGTFTISGWS